MSVVLLGACGPGDPLRKLGEDVSDAISVLVVLGGVCMGVFALVLLLGCLFNIAVNLRRPTRGTALVGVVGAVGTTGIGLLFAVAAAVDSVNPEASLWATLAALAGGLVLIALGVGMAGAAFLGRKRVRESH